MAGILIATILSGCATPEEGGSQVSVRYESGSIEVEDSQPNENRVNGTLRGRVRDTLNVSIPDAAVSLLGTHGFAVTNESGDFVMEELPPGRHVLRIDPSSQYVPLEEVVVVEAGAEVRVVVTIPYRQEVPAGFRPHVHDYWDADGTYTMFDGELAWATENDAAALAQQTYQTHSSDFSQIPDLAFLFPQPVDEHRPILVIPGAKSMTISLDWSQSDVRTDKLGIWFLKPGDGDWGCTCWWSRTGVSAAGTEFTIEILPEHWDDAHQAFTFWMFALDLGLSIQNARADNTPVVVGGSVHVSIELEKGSDPPVDPAHPAWWEQNTTLELPLVRSGGNAKMYVLSSGNIVPPGTERLVVNHTWSTSSTNPPVEWKMRFRTADQEVVRTPSDQWRTTSSTICGPACRTYEIELQPGWADGWYQENSLWAFEAFTTDALGAYYMPIVSSGGQVFTTTAYKSGSEDS